MVQPALRIRTVPRPNPSNKCQPGKPSAATHSAVSVGKINTSQPAGRLKRIKSKYSASRERGAGGEEGAITDIGTDCAHKGDWVQGREQKRDTPCGMSLGAVYLGIVVRFTL